MIVVCGEALIDFTPTTVDGAPAFVQRFGGSPCNVAIGLARLGVCTAFVGKLSRDAFGDALYDKIADEGVRLQWAVRGSEPTALAFVVPNTDGTHDFAFYGANTADQSMRPEDLPDTLPDDAALHFGSCSLVLGSSAQTYETLIRREHTRRLITMDPNVRPMLFPQREAYARRIETLLPFTHIVKASAEDLAWLYPGYSPQDVALRWLGGIGAAETAETEGKKPLLVVITLGADGAMAFADGAAVRISGEAVSVADTVGAGDAFMSALLAYLDRMGALQTQSIRTLSADTLAHALAYANRAAALTCTRTGADPPTSDELAANLSVHRLPSI